MAATSQEGKAEIRAALGQSRQLFASCALFSVFVNLLMLTGPLFMLQVYDRVLTSRSLATLVAFIAIVTFLFVMLGVLDHARARVLARAGARLQAQLDSRVLRAVLSRATSPAQRSRPETGLRDLESIQRFASNSGPFAFFDAPWTPVFLFALFMFHWMLGLLAISSGCVLLVLALLNQKGTAKLQEQAREASDQSGYFIEQMRAGGETVQGLGMHDAVVARSGALRDTALDKTLENSDRGGLFNVTSKTLRLYLQSMMLGLGAVLVISGDITPGVMIAASILLGRALAPIDQAVGQWPLLQRTLAGYHSLAGLLSETPPEKTRTPLPPPRAILEAQGLMVAAPGARHAAVRAAFLRLEPGQAAGIAGASASGKSTLARALAGVWRPMGGSVRLDGAELEQYGSDLGRHIGYLPQEVMLFDGSVSDNIARMSPDIDNAAVIEAAKRTGAHEMILALPDGYDFQVSAGGAALSGGQRQRIALARAFFGSPVVVVMDEPDSNLDAEGTMALARAVQDHKRRNGAAVIVAHRHGAFAQCDTVYLMEGGRPIPASAGTIGKPVRSLQAHTAQGGEKAPAANGRPRARQAPVAQGRQRPAPVPSIVRDARNITQPARPASPARPGSGRTEAARQRSAAGETARSRREAKIARAVGRVKTASTKGDETS